MYFNNIRLKLGHLLQDLLPLKLKPQSGEKFENKALENRVTDGFSEKKISLTDELYSKA